MHHAAAERGARIGINKVSGAGSALCITAIEFAPGAVQELREALDRIAPVHGGYSLTPL